MRRALLLSAVIAAAGLGGPAAPALALAAPAPKLAVNDPVIGVGEQTPGVFADPFFTRLGVRHVRYVVAWDALRKPLDRAEVDRWMAAAEAARVRVLLAFNVSRDLAPAPRRALARPLPAHVPVLPRPLSVRDRVHHLERGQPPFPAHRAPAAAGRRYHDVASRACPRCTILAADLLDDDSVPAWVKAFRRHARVEPRLWGLHNYIDANRFRTRGTRQMLRAVRGRIWFTETGGLVWRRGGTPLDESAPHAARATRWVFRLANLSRRIRRVYFYHWSVPDRVDRWDSAIMDRHGRPRPAYRVLRNHLLRAAERSAARRIDVLPRARRG